MSEVIYIKQYFRKNSLALVFFVLTFFFFVPSFLFAASYSISPASGSFEKGKNFSVRVMVNAVGDSPNSGSGSITYDTNKLTAVSVSKDGSPFTMWIPGGEPTIKGGMITFEGGGYPAISSSKSIFTIIFKGKSEGSAKIDFSKSLLLGGPGTDVLSGTTGATYTITPASADTAPTEDDPPKEKRDVKIPPPDEPVIKSSTHPDGELWYSASDTKFKWDVPFGVLGVLVGFNKEQNGTTTELHEPAISVWDKDSVEDGVWFFHAEYKNRGGWGSSTHFKVNVDTTPPDEFETVAIGGDNTAEVRFEAHDTLSGIDVYRITIDGGNARDVQPEELISSGYKLTGLDPGEHTITVVAIDKAGNERSSDAFVTATGDVQTEEDDEMETSGFGAIYWVSLLFMAALAVTITMLVQERRKYHEERDHIKRETMEVGDRLINIFGVLRDEIEEKVIDLSHKPNMTDIERNILEGLKDALDISEELIDKEVEDVRKLLK